MAKEQTTFTHPSDTSQPANRHHRREPKDFTTIFWTLPSSLPKIVTALLKQRGLTELRQLQRFGRLLKWPADQPLLAKYKSSKPVETFTPPYAIIPLTGFPPSIILTGLSPGAYRWPV